jgi:hypothetical protein
MLRCRGKLYCIKIRHTVAEHGNRELGDDIVKRERVDVE